MPTPRSWFSKFFVGEGASIDVEGSTDDAYRDAIWSRARRRDAAQTSPLDAEWTAGGFVPYGGPFQYGYGPAWIETSGMPARTTADVGFFGPSVDEKPAEPRVELVDGRRAIDLSGKLELK